VLSIGSVVLGCADVRRATAFWTRALRYVPRDPAAGRADADWVVLVPADGPEAGPGLSLGRSDVPVQARPRVHLDLYARDAADQAAEVARLLALGAERVDWDSYPPDADFVVLADTEGNRFCVIDTGRAAGDGPRVAAAGRDYLPDELDHAGPEHLDPAFVAGFDRKQGHPDPSPDIAALRAHGLGPDATVIDHGAGTGRFALAAAREFGQVIAVDVSPAMTAHLRDAAAAAGLANLRCVRAGFLSYRHQGPPADAVYTRHALHQLPDVWKTVALARIAETLRPGGLLRLIDLVYDCEPAEAEPLFRDWLDSAPTGDPAAGYTRDDYAEHLRTEHSTFRWLLEPMLERAGFEILTADYDGRLFGGYTCCRRG
jgi:ubiquinone/menaquinone biosynthesis C-methylase UbiE